jgi:di/tricarboxylate transporter
MSVQQPALLPKETQKEASSLLASFSRHRSKIGMFVGLAICLGIWFMPSPAGLPIQGQHCLALSLLAVTWWAFGVIHSGYTSLLLLLAWTLTKTAEPAVVFRLWTSPLMYLVIGGYLIAAAVEISGLGRRIAYHFILRFVSGYRSIIASCYVLGFLLSILIPHPWPRSFMIMSVMAIIIRSAKLEPKFAMQIGLTVFAASCPSSMILLTGDSTLNVVAMNFGGETASYLRWLWAMGVPGVAACVLLYFMQIWFFPAPKDFVIEKAEIRDLLSNLGKTTTNEKKVIAWIAIAVAFWVTDFLHHVHPGWIAAGAAIAMTLPIVGGVLKPGDWSKVNLGSLFFLTAALGIGTVGDVTGMNKWVAAVVLPSHAPTNIFVFALVVTAFAVAIHMILGSVLAVMGIVTPAVIAFSASAGISPLVASLLVYTAVNQHYLLPFHNMAILVGEGEQGGGYGSAEVLKLGLPLTILVFIVTIGVEIPWWKCIGLIH